MKYVLAVLFSAFAALGSFASASAGEATPRSLVVIDTGFDTSLPSISRALVFEACTLNWSNCPNGLSFQEGSGAALLPSALWRSSGFSHGTEMASIALSNYPEIRLVLIRLIAASSNGTRLPTNETGVERALDWVLVNQSKFNIGAVAMAQGHHNLGYEKSYCPKTPSVQKKIKTLKDLGVPLFLPAGNAGDKSKIDWPACLPESVAIGAIDDKGQIPSYSNMDRLLSDFYTVGQMQTTLPGGATSSSKGTSVSTLVAASNWVRVQNLYPNLGYQEIFQLFRGTGKIVFDSKYRYGRAIDMGAMLQFIQESNSLKVQP